MMKRIDAHVHFPGNHPDSIQFVRELGYKLLNISVAQDSHGAWRSQFAVYPDLARQHPECFAWCTSFDLPRFEDPRYIADTVAGLEKDFAEGAIAVKAWKNLGMEVKNPRGEWVTVDDPFLSPIFDHVERSGKTLLMHIAEPLACWSPLVEGNPHSGYYSQHPEWHMFGKKDVLSHEALIASRDRILTRHPRMKVVGAHFGSMEYDVAVIARCLDRYSNLAVDTSGRIRDLSFQDSAVVRSFFIDYQDRILFGTDAVGFQFHSELTPAERKTQIDGYRTNTATWHDYLSSDQEVIVSGKKTRGLGLPADVLEKIYYTNAVRWYPGL